MPKTYELYDNRIINKDESLNAWLGLGNTSDIIIKDNPLFFKNKFFDEHPGLWDIQQLKSAQYLSYTAWVLCGIKLPPFQAAILYELWTHNFPMFIACRGAGKTFLLAIYSLLRSIFFLDYKIVLAGAAFRQSKLIFEEMENIWNNAPVLQSMCDSTSRISRDTDRWTFYLNSSRVTAIPIGPTGDKIRGLRANTVILDEFASHNPQIVEEVIFGFMSVKNDPAEGIVQAARRDYLGSIAEEIDTETNLQTGDYQNQGIIAGTADYYFNHYYDYWQRYKKIIYSKGDPLQLRNIFDGDVPESFDYKQYTIIRLPYDAIPKGFMDDSNIARSRANMSKSLFNKEFQAVFVEDSDGFFRRSLIESCVASDTNMDRLGDKWAPWCPVPFHADTRGNPTGQYVFGIDPASEVDNFAIVILELYPEHHRIVYAWTTNRKNFQERKRQRSTSVDDYYHFCARKIRDLMKVFPCVAIGVDMQGGGLALTEALHDKDKTEKDEEPIWYIIDENKENDTDLYAGLHIIHPIQFASPTWTSQANWGLLKDLQDKKFLFPGFDPLSIEISVGQDKMRQAEFTKNNPGRSIHLFDSLEDCVLEIEELKNELTSIIYTHTGAHVNSREKWSTPETVTEDKKRIGGRKDRYSALVIANSIARTMSRKEKYTLNKGSAGGGLISQLPRSTGGPDYYGPDWYVNPQG